ncbi:hypothetical protein N8I74_00425 [Chitiniphilus purpureus]|uniref:Uncharacterized protein n=1 Tax=Chitiniphilus purpureus TaxID=2981137 RepID=A0ABY6DMC0_9NEIS|nr:hypothetical protein [Chitiniphilus sp. CD1]UXY15515.1 hypothetical protein N8I74_00425 [Chitiniphilus sp. CD1]
MEWLFIFFFSQCGGVEGRQAGFSSKDFLWKFDFIYMALFGSGLSPLMIAIYFLILKKTVRGNFIGLIYAVLLVPFHYYVMAIAAHNTKEVYLPYLVLRFIILLSIIFLFSGCNFIEVDKCLDRGGRWNKEKNICEFQEIKGESVK